MSVNEFDNEYTLLYKSVLAFGSPVPLIYKENGQYKSMTQLISSAYRTGYRALAIYDTLIDSGQDVDVRSFSYVYLTGTGARPTVPDDYLERARDLEAMYKERVPSLAGSLVINPNDRTSTYAFITRYDSSINDRYKNDLKILGDINKVQKEMLDSMQGGSRFLNTKVETISVVLVYTPTLNGAKVSKEFGYDIFNSSVVSPLIPYIQYVNNEEQSYYKVYTGSGTSSVLSREELELAARSTGSSVNYYHAIANIPADVKKNTIYMSLWMGTSNNMVSTSDMYVPVIYNLDENNLNVNVLMSMRGENTNGKINAPVRISAALPSLVIGEGVQGKIRARYNMIPVYASALNRLQSGQFVLDQLGQSQFDIVEYTLYHYLLLKDCFFRNFYSEEGTTPTPMKKRMDLFYRPMFSDIYEPFIPVNNKYISNSATVSFSLRVRKSEEGSNFRVMESRRFGIQNDSDVLTIPNYNYLTVKVKKADSMESINQFMLVLTSLMTIYHWDYMEKYNVNPQSVPELYKYLQYIPRAQNLKAQRAQLEQAKKTEAERVVARRSRSGRYGELKEKFGEVFGGGYAHKCRSAFQPIVVKTLEEAERWTQVTHMKTGFPTPRKYMPYPAPPEPTLFYVICPNDNAPYPTVIENTTGHGEDKFKYVPCCSVIDQMRGGNNTYSKYYLDMERGGEETVTDVIRTGGLLERGQYSSLPYEVETALKYYNSYSKNFYRRGVSKSPSSLLHCVLEAINDRTYAEAYNDVLKNGIVANIRKWLAGYVKPSVFKQEMYDYLDQDIIAQISDNNFPLDSALHYRMIEEVFNINLITFYTPEKFNSDNGELEVPRHLYYHIRRVVDSRPIVLLFKHWGIESDKSQYPVYEIIVEVGPSRTNPGKYLQQTIFETNMNNICKDIVEKTHGKITWMPKKDGAPTTYDDIYDMYDLTPSIITGAVSQYIDSVGKRRRITFMHAQVGLVTLYHPPAQPLNIPESPVINSITYEAARVIFRDTATGVTYEANNMIGLWYPLYTIPNMIYVSVVNPGNASVNLPVGPRDPYKAQNSGVVVRSNIDRITDMERTLNILKQLMLWVINLTRRDNPQAEDQIISLFVRDLIFFNSSSSITGDSAYFYDISRVPYRLPDVKNYQEAMYYIKSHTTNVLNDKYQFIMYSPKFYTGMVGWLLKYYRDTLRGKNPVPKVLNNYYSNYRIFKQVPNAEIFVGSDNFDKWLYKKMSPSDIYIIKKYVNLAYASNLEPYLYQNEDTQKIYMIQNPRDGSMESAAAIAKKWFYESVNEGPDIEPLKVGSVPANFVFGVSAYGQLIPIQDNTSGNQIYINLVYYGASAEDLSGGTARSRFGAILELL